MSQLGPTTQTLTFHADGTYALELVMKGMPATPIRAEGPYRVEGERVVFGDGAKATSSTIAWREGDLVLTERNGDRYTLSRVSAK